jgi:hypothetical protein
MSSLSKWVGLFFILIMSISSLSLIVKPALAQATSQPSVPEFTLKIVVHPYDVPPITTTDPYTGNNVTTRVGYNVQNMSLELIIPNQPFTSYKNSNGTTLGLYYIVAWKGHYENDWRTSLPHYLASDSAYTVLSFGINVPEYANYDGEKLGNFPIESQLDFQLEALIGYYTEITVPLFPNDDSSPLTTKDIFHGENSNWTNTQTVTIPETSFISSSPNPTASPTNTLTSPTPTVPEISWLAILPLFVSMLFVAVILRHRKLLT